MGDAVRVSLSAMSQPFRDTDTEPLPLTDALRAKLAALEPLGFNYSVEHDGPIDPVHGWTVDAYRIDLPAEPSGAPLSAGSFAAARRALASMRFVNPARILVYFDPGAPLRGRTLLLRVRLFAGLMRLEFGARVTRATAENEGEIVSWGFAYGTLATHFEMGEIAFAVHKHRATGAVWVTIDRFSKLGPIRNPFLVLGARLLARPLQLQYARYVARRIPALVSGILREPSTLKRSAL